MWQKVKNIYHFFTALAANCIYGFPGRKLIIIGVTGTDGKTTTVSLIYHILIHSGKSASMVSTVGSILQGEKKHLGFHVTTPRIFEMQKFLSTAAKSPAKKNYVVLEVSSHAIDQYRVWGIPFAIGVITNVTEEHLDYHKTSDAYLQTKAKLLQRAKVAIVNADDRSYRKLAPLLKGRHVITYGIHNRADVTATTYAYRTNLIGEFNTYNILAAVSACRSLGIDEASIKKAIATFETPVGRMNMIKNKRGLTIIVDYAHTPNGLEQALLTLKRMKKEKARIISLVGAEGFRDPGKRTKIGKIAAKLSDIVIITAVDPRGLESEINTQILKGAEEAGGILNTSVFIEPDREKAIALALRTLAKKGDIVGLFGKGHERSMNYDGRHEVHWNDTETVQKIVQTL